MTVIYAYENVLSTRYSPFTSMIVLLISFKAKNHIWKAFFLLIQYSMLNRLHCRMVWLLKYGEKKFVAAVFKNKKSPKYAHWNGVWTSLRRKAFGYCNAKQMIKQKRLCWFIRDEPTPLCDPIGCYLDKIEKEHSYFAWSCFIYYEDWFLSFFIQNISNIFGLFQRSNNMKDTKTVLPAIFELHK